MQTIFATQFSVESCARRGDGGAVASELQASGGALGFLWVSSEAIIGFVPAMT